jgi:hypothetical protein
LKKIFINLLNIVLFFTVSDNLFGNDKCAKVYNSFFPLRKEAVRSDVNSIFRYNTLFLYLDRNWQYESESVELEPEGINWNFHKISGYATLMTGVGAVITGFQGKDKPHCILSFTSLALAVTSVCNGIYKYGKNIESSEDKVQNMIHVIGSISSTLGFLTVSFIPEGKIHGHIGTASGVTMILSTGILYF